MCEQEVSGMEAVTEEVRIAGTQNNSYQPSSLVQAQG